MSQWRECAGRFAELHCQDLLDGRALEYLGATGSHCPLLIACSGGRDSVFLVLAMLARFKDCPERLRILHFNHRTRGADSEADARFVKNLADGLDLKFQTGSASDPIDPTEDALRKARYDWMSEVYTESKACGLCLGHHADDILESILMGALSGSGVSGLASPMPVRRFPDGHVRIRPLLPLEREEIERLLVKAGVPWREDLSNLNTAYTRNWLRNEWIPELKENFPQDVVSGSRRTRELMEEMVDLLDSLVGKLSLDMSDPARISVSLLYGQPAALIRRAVSAWWLQHNPDKPIPKAALARLIEAIHGREQGESVSIGSGLCLLLDATGCLILRKERPSTFPDWGRGCRWSWGAGPLFLPDGSVLHGELSRWGEEEEPPFRNADPAREVWLSLPDPTLQVRQWKPGDRFRPMGAPGRKKLQDLFTDAKLQTEQKRKVPVIANLAGEILWIPGFPPAEMARVRPESNSALQLTYEPA